MKGIISLIGWLLLTVGGALILLGIASWPPGGLMFALPYIFLIPGVPLAVAGGLLVLLGRRAVKGSGHSLKNGSHSQVTEQDVSKGADGPRR